MDRTEDPRGRPCIDICRPDEHTDWCLGCGMTKREKKAWKRDPTLRAAILAQLPVRLQALSGQGLPTGKAARQRKR